MDNSNANSADKEESREEDIKKLAERIIRANKDVFILSSLLTMQMCGYDLIKDIFSRCDVFLSQGAVYPILYSLEEEGILRAEFGRGDMRTKRYVLTPEGREVAQKRVDDFIRAAEYASLLVKR